MLHLGRDDHPTWANVTSPVTLSPARDQKQYAKSRKLSAEDAGWVRTGDMEWKDGPDGVYG